VTFMLPQVMKQSLGQNHQGGKAAAWVTSLSGFRVLHHPHTLRAFGARPLTFRPKGPATTHRTGGSAG